MVDVIDGIMTWTVVVVGAVLLVSGAVALARRSHPPLMGRVRRGSGPPAWESALLFLTTGIAGVTVALPVVLRADVSVRLIAWLVALPFAFCAVVLLLRWPRGAGRDR